MTTIDAAQKHLVAMQEVLNAAAADGVWMEIQTVASRYQVDVPLLAGFCAFTIANKPAMHLPNGNDTQLIIARVSKDDLNQSDASKEFPERYFNINRISPISAKEVVSITSLIVSIGDGYFEVPVTPFAGFEKDPKHGANAYSFGGSGLLFITNETTYQESPLPWYPTAKEMLDKVNFNVSFRLTGLLDLATGNIQIHSLLGPDENTLGYRPINESVTLTGAEIYMLSDLKAEIVGYMLNVPPC